MFLIYYLNWIFHPWANSFIADFGTFCSVQPSKKECLPCFLIFFAKDEYLKSQNMKCYVIWWEHWAEFKNRI